jgi:hypothetical protein
VLNEYNHYEEIDVEVFEEEKEDSIKEENKEYDYDTFEGDADDFELINDEDVLNEYNRYQEIDIEVFQENPDDVVPEENIEYDYGTFEAEADDLEPINDEDVLNEYNHYEEIDVDVFQENQDDIVQEEYTEYFYDIFEADADDLEPINDEDVLNEYNRYEEINVEVFQEDQDEFIPEEFTEYDYDTFEGDAGDLELINDEDVLNEYNRYEEIDVEVFQENQDELVPEEYTEYDYETEVIELDGGDLELIIELELMEGNAEDEDEIEPYKENEIISDDSDDVNEKENFENSKGDEYNGEVVYIHDKNQETLKDDNFSESYKSEFDEELSKESDSRYDATLNNELHEENEHSIEIQIDNKLQTPENIESFKSKFKESEFFRFSKSKGEKINWKEDLNLINKGSDKLSCNDKIYISSPSKMKDPKAEILGNFEGLTATTQTTETTQESENNSDEKENENSSEDTKNKKEEDQEENSKKDTKDNTLKKEFKVGVQTLKEKIRSEIQKIVKEVEDDRYNSQNKTCNSQVKQKGNIESKKSINKKLLRLNKESWKIILKDLRELYDEINEKWNFKSNEIELEKIINRLFDLIVEKSKNEVDGYNEFKNYKSFHGQSKRLLIYLIKALPLYLTNPKISYQKLWRIVTGKRTDAPKTFKRLLPYLKIKQNSRNFPIKIRIILCRQILKFLMEGKTELEVFSLAKEILENMEIRSEWSRIINLNELQRVKNLLIRNKKFLNHHIKSLIKFVKEVRRIYESNEDIPSPYNLKNRLGLKFGRNEIREIINDLTNVFNLNFFFTEEDFQWFKKNGIDVEKIKLLRSRWYWISNNKRFMNKIKKEEKNGIDLAIEYLFQIVFKNVRSKFNLGEYEIPSSRMILSTRYNYFLQKTLKKSHKKYNELLREFGFDVVHDFPHQNKTYEELKKFFMKKIYPFYNLKKNIAPYAKRVSKDFRGFEAAVKKVSGKSLTDLFKDLRLELKYDYKYLNLSYKDLKRLFINEIYSNLKKKYNLKNNVAPLYNKIERYYRGFIKALYKYKKSYTTFLRELKLQPQSEIRSELGILLHKAFRLIISNFLNKKNSFKYFSEVRIFEPKRSMRIDGLIVLNKSIKKNIIKIFKEVIDEEIIRNKLMKLIEKNEYLLIDYTNVFRRKYQLHTKRLYIKSVKYLKNPKKVLLFFIGTKWSVFANVFNLPKYLKYRKKVIKTSKMAVISPELLAKIIGLEGSSLKLFKEIIKYNKEADLEGLYEIIEELELNEIKIYSTKELKKELLESGKIKRNLYELFSENRKVKNLDRFLK